MSGYRRGPQLPDEEFDWTDQTILGYKVLPPPSNPPEPETCWAQACVNAAEATYRYQWGLAGREFPSLSVEHCIASLRTPERYLCSTRDVERWLLREGVATVEDYNMHRMAATDKYQILDWDPFYVNDVPRHVRDGALIGSYTPFFTSRVDGHTSIVIDTDMDTRFNTHFPGHAVMITGFKRVNGKLTLKFYSGYNTIETMDAECIDIASKLIVPAPIGACPPG